MNVMQVHADVVVYEDNLHQLQDNQDHQIQVAVAAPGKLNRLY